MSAAHSSPCVTGAWAGLSSQVKAGSQERLSLLGSRAGSLEATLRTSFSSSPLRPVPSFRASVPAFAPCLSVRGDASALAEPQATSSSEAHLQELPATSAAKPEESGSAVEKNATETEASQEVSSETVVEKTSNGAAREESQEAAVEASAIVVSEDAEKTEDGFYEPQFELLAAAKVLPHPDKVEKGGEDAFLISDVGAGVICVADGVGGWANDGVDPALYSKELVYHIQSFTEAAECQEDLEAKLLLANAHAATTAEGAATAVLAVFDGESSTLDIANIGDSGLLVVRNGEIFFKTPSQQHFFDCPYQLGSESTDSPADAEVYSLELKEGDTLVMASDGLFDNVFDKDIACVVKVFGGQDTAAVQRAATALAALASKHAADPEYMSPYVEDALKEGKDLPIWEKMLGRKLSGGKLDDITVVVAQVVKAGAS